jgi:cell division protein FtsZ
MKGAKGVIISITGGDDMRLMEVDEAANHIRELVDPDANIIWGSAFNNDLDGKIRVSVVATGIGAEEIMPIPQPAKVFAFPAARVAEPKIQARADEPAPLTLIPPEGIDEEKAQPVTAAAGETPADSGMTTMADTAEMTETTHAMPAEAMTEDESGDELLLDSVDMVADEPVAEEEAPDRTAATGTRSWLTRDETETEPAPEPRQTGTLFERMSNIARGAAKAQVDEEQEEGPRMRASGRDPLDIPRFLNRQNNQ